METEVGSRRLAPSAPRRRTGDTVAIPGDYQYRAWTAGPRVQRFWHDTKRWLVETYLQPGPGMQALDVGCGSGVVSDALAAAGVSRCLGVDGNPEAVAFASRTFRRPNLEFRRGLVDELELPADSFDVMCCFELIEHIYPEQGVRLLRDLHRLGRPGAKLLITTPNYRSLWPAIEVGLDRLRLVPRLADEQHVAFYHHRRLRELAGDAGWATRIEHTCCTVAPWLAAVSTRLARAVRRREGWMPCGTLLVHLLEKRDGGDGPERG